MKTTKKISKIISVVALGALFFNTFTPVIATTAAEISGNGAQSENEVEVQTEQEQTVVQQNQAIVKNYIEADVSSGDNEANDNTNGDVAIHTGSATANTNINNNVNANTAVIEDCTGCQEDIWTKISGNGAESDNDIEVDSQTETSIFQDNKAGIDNRVDVDVESGDNEANRNTEGKTIITTGSATANTNVNNLANDNFAALVPGLDNGFGFKEAEISGNGAKSENEIEIEQEHEVTIVQNNWADIFNKVEADVSSGDNEAEDNTNGDVAIHTGPATANTNLNNEANFNFAEVECCLFDKIAKVSGNGADSENQVEFEHEDSLSVFQNGEKKDDEDNDETDTNGWTWSVFENWVQADPNSGDNEAERDTGPEQDPVVITTSPATSNVNVNNKGGVNTFIREDSLCFSETLPFCFDFDMGDVFGALFQ